jgi:hypothetical protein
VTTGKKANDLADRMPGVAAPLTDERRTLLRAIFRAGAVAELAAGWRAGPADAARLARQPGADHQP